MLYLKKLLVMLNPLQRKQSMWLLLTLILVAMLDMIGVASILPFIAILTNPGLIETNPILSYMYQASAIFGVDNQKHFLFASGLLVFFFLVLSLIFKAFATYFQVRFVKECEYNFSKLFVEGYLSQPYAWFLNRHSAELGRTVLTESAQIVGGCIKPLLEVTAKGAITIALLILLLVADTKLALIVGFSLGGAYGAFFYLVRTYLRQTGQTRLVNDQIRFRAVSDAFNAVKEIKVGGLEKSYINLFSHSAYEYAKSNTYAETVGLLPRFILEAVAFGGILLIILYVMMGTGSFTSALPILSLYVFAGYRLMPALQQIYVSLTQITFSSTAINKLYEDRKKFKLLTNNQNKKNNSEILIFKKNISIENVYFNYPNTSKATLENINLNIPAKSIIGFIGPTGSGKTTTVDIILGLLEPQKGTMKIDGKILTEQNSRSWGRSIGYVPQQIYLSDNSIASNIALGLDPKNINQAAVERAAKIANIHQFIIEELPNQYQTEIGERGVRLSGGQRQRIGIARALYHKPKLLILDEATNALDNETEKAVMEAVNNLDKDITIILIAHRTNTLKICDYIYKLEKGKIVDQGTYKSLIDKNIFNL